MIIFTMLNLGESHTGKTQAIGTLPGRTVLFNFEPPDNVTSLRVPVQETKRLTEFWKTGAKIEKVLVVQYGLLAKKLDLKATASPSRDKMTAFIEDVNSMEHHLGEFDHIVIETLGPFADEVLDFIVASNGRSDTQIQDYNIAVKKISGILGSIMGLGKDFVLTGHLQNEKDDITGRGKTLPLAWGRTLPPMIPKLFGEVFCSVIVGDGKGGIKYQWLTKPEAGGFLQFLGSRKFNNLPKYLEQDFGYLEKLQKEGGK